MEQPVSSVMARREFPSISIPTIPARSSIESLFIRKTYRTSIPNVKHNIQFNRLSKIVVDSLGVDGYHGRERESGCGMDVEFRDRRLALVEMDRAAETRLPISVITSLRRKL